LVPMILKTIYESMVQAFQQLASNKLRSFLSLSGIVIGIICIISVLSAVDSLKENINASFEKLGNDVLYVSKQPWNEDPHQNFWKYLQRPEPSFEDLEVLKRKSKLAAKASFAVVLPSRVIKFGSSNVEGAFMAGITDDYVDVFNLTFEKGRFFTAFESAHGTNLAVIGSVLADKLFGTIDPIGKEINVKGQNFMVIGVLEKEGNTLINLFKYDEAILISFNSVKKLINVKSRNVWSSSLSIKAREGVSMDDLRDEITGILRSARKIKPKEDENFSINQLTTITNLIEPVFGTLNIVGIFIGGFSILVGMFSVANIMFVSVKERTSMIGIKKALGARKTTILLEFLIESVMLCAIGGAIGLANVWVLLTVATSLSDFDMFLSKENVMLAMVLSLVIGVLSGLVPAWQAARLDPVEAMRK
jgi:putative ABC transport system permease protein